MIEQSNIDLIITYTIVDDDDNYNKLLVTLEVEAFPVHGNSPIKADIQLPLIMINDRILLEYITGIVF